MRRIKGGGCRDEGRVFVHRPQILAPTSPGKPGSYNNPEILAPTSPGKPGSYNNPEIRVPTTRWKGIGDITGLQDMLKKDTLLHRLYLIKVLFWRDFESHYIQNRLGLTWVVLNPLFIVLLYTFVFAVVLSIRNPQGAGTYSYAVFLLSGMIPYLAISEVMQTSSACLSEKKTLLIKSIFPADVLPVVAVLLSVVGEAVTLSMVLAVAVYEHHGDIKLLWLLIPLLVLLRVLFSLGLAWWISILAVFIPDLRQALGLVTSAWMFLTPILYPLETGPANFRGLQDYNPLYIIVAAYRSVILQGAWPDMRVLWWWVLIFVGLNVSGYWLFKKLLPRAKDFL